MATETDKPGAGAARPAQAVRDTAKRLGDVSLDALRAATDGAKSGADQSDQASGEAFRFARPGAGETSGRMLDWIGGSTSVARSAMEAGQEMTTAMLDFTRGHLQRSMEGLAAVARCRTVPELLAVQGDLMRDGLRDAVAMGQKIVEITTKASTQAQKDSPPAQSG
jgi:hypothetical protein